jgi:hypothetical protein
MTKPDKWVIIEITVENKIYHKVFASFYGGYLDEDSWKINSGINKLEENDTHYYFHGYSGSVYRCQKGQ